MSLDDVAVGVRHVEIPVRDLDRAAAFYAAVFGVDLERVEADGYSMALFPPVSAGADVALVLGDVYVPAKTGPLVYFGVSDLDASLARAQAAGATVLYPPTRVGDWGRVTEFEDSEGNRIGLHQRA